MNPVTTNRGRQMSSQPPQDPNQPQDPGGSGSPQPPQDPNQPENRGGYGSPQPPAPQYQAPQYGSSQPPGQQYGQAPGYASAPPPPDGGQGPGSPYATAGTTNQPPSIKQAVLLMRVGAALSALGLILSLVTLGNIKDLIRNTGVGSGTSLTEAQVNAAATAALIAAVIFGLIGVGLWLWMASANGKGKKWARVVATVFFVLSLLSILANVAQGKTPVPSLVLGVVTVILGAYVIFLLYKKESTAFYDGMTAARTPR